MNGKIVLRESNVVSLRTAFVTDNGNLIELRLNPADLESVIPKGRAMSSPQDFKWVLKDSVWIYRHARSAEDELNLAAGSPCVERKVRPMSFETPPKLRFLWADSGHSVALFLNGEPWAFIDERSHRGYSKGIIDETWGNQWRQELFEQLF